MGHLQELSEKVVKRMHNIGYAQDVIDKLKLIDSEENLAGLRTIKIREILEEFLKESVSFAPVGFFKDKNKPVLVREFIRDMRFVSQEEFEFISSFYGLLSHIGAHSGATKSKIDPIVAGYINWHIFDLVTSRIKTPKKLERRQGKFEKDSVYYSELIEDFLLNLRKENFKGRGFETNFDREAMRLARTKLKNTDATPLLKLLTDSTANQDLQNRAASLLLSDNLIADQKLKENIIRQMSQHYQTNFNSLNWKVFRAIALALSNRVNYDGCILNYIKWIEENNQRLKENLKITEDYHASKKTQIIKLYLNRITNPDIPLAGCVWEIFYLGKRATPKDKIIIKAINKRVKKTENPELLRICNNALNRLS